MTKRRMAESLCCRSSLVRTSGAIRCSRPGGSTTDGVAKTRDLLLNSTSAKLFELTAGSTQTVTSSLELAGASGDLLQIRSSLDGSEAFLDLQGSQSVAFVDVKDNHAIGNSIRLSMGSISSGNTLGWQPPMLPGLSLLGMGLLVLALLWGGRRHIGSGDYRR